jgi:hypothetical protein
MSKDSADQILELLGPVPDVNSLRPDSKADIFSAAFDLYRDTA